MRNFEELFKAFKHGEHQSRKSGMLLLSADAALRIYYGISAHGHPRLAFMSASPSPDIQSTRAIRVSSATESDDVNWLFLDLVEDSSRAVYFALCDDLVSVIENLKSKDEQEALLCLKNRFASWRKMFTQERSRLTDEQLAGLWGELYFMQQFMIPEYGAAQAISAWSGPDRTNKDYSIGEKWYEIKSVTVNAASVKISSLPQLSSEATGVLAIVRYEEMSASYDDPFCTTFILFRMISASIQDEEARSALVSKLLGFGFNVFEESDTRRFRPVDMPLYKVSNAFPRIQEKDVPFKEIDKVSYSLLINGIDRFKFDGRL